jgi:hypothetical protein
MNRVVENRKHFDDVSLDMDIDSQTLTPKEELEV